MGDYIAAIDARPATALSPARDRIPDHVLELYRASLARAVDDDTKQSVWERVLLSARALSARDIESASKHDDEKRFAMSDPAPTEDESLRHMDTLKRDFQSMNPPAFAAQVAVSLSRMRNAELAVLLDYACQSIARDYVRLLPFQNAHFGTLPVNHDRFIANFLLLVRSLSLTRTMGDTEWDLIGILLMVAYLEANRSMAARQDAEIWSERKISGYQSYFAEYLSKHVLLPLATHHPINRHLMSWERLFQRTLLWASGAMRLPFDARIRQLHTDGGLRIAEHMIYFTRPEESRPYWDGTLVDPARRLSAAQERVIEARRLLADAKAAVDKAESDLYIEHSNVQHLPAREEEIAAAAKAKAKPSPKPSGKVKDEDEDEDGARSSSQRAKRQRFVRGRAGLASPAAPTVVEW